MSKVQLTIPADDLRRILVIRRNRMGDMICTLPLLRALREKFPQATLKVVCDELGAPIAQACEAVDEVVVLKKGFNRLHTRFRNRRQLRNRDLTIGVKVGFDKTLAALIRCSGARYQIGFADDAKASIYTHPVPLPPFNEHQIDSCLRLLEPLGIKQPKLDLHLELPAKAIEFAEELATKNKFAGRSIVIFNLSYNRAAAWPLENFAELGRLVLQSTNGLIGLSCLPKDYLPAEKLRSQLNSDSVFILQPTTPLELAAVLRKTNLLVTPEGGAAHLAATTATPAIVLWPLHGVIDKWQSRCASHHQIRSKDSLADISVAEVWAVILQKFLPASQ
jgi:ADP-heptose:LPS heptosyltransferase